MVVRVLVKPFKSLPTMLVPLADNFLKISTMLAKLGDILSGKQQNIALMKGEKFM
jgi:hypothetical protein